MGETAGHLATCPPLRAALGRPHLTGLLIALHVAIALGRSWRTQSGFTGRSNASSRDPQIMCASCTCSATTTMLDATPNSVLHTNTNRRVVLRFPPDNCKDWNDFARSLFRRREMLRPKHKARKECTNNTKAAVLGRLQMAKRDVRWAVKLDRPERLLFNFMATSRELELKWRKTWTGYFSSSL
jgi:hypothetical protein